MVKLSAVLALGVSCWLGVGLPVDLAVANTCANCGRQPIRFKTGKPVRVEVVNFTAGLVLLEDVQASDPIPVSPGRTFRLTRRTSTEGPNGSVVFWDAQGLPLRATVRQPVIDLMRIELRPWGQQPGDRSVYLEDDGRVSVL